MIGCMIFKQGRGSHDHHIPLAMDPGDDFPRVLQHLHLSLPWAEQAHGPIFAGDQLPVHKPPERVLPVRRSYLPKELSFSRILHCSLAGIFTIIVNYLRT